MTIAWILLLVVPDLRTIDTVKVVQYEYSTLEACQSAIPAVRRYYRITYTPECQKQIAETH